MDGSQCLYLFSSNRSALYSQDILNVLAAPDGTHYTFRYDEQYVEHATAQAWETLVPGTRVLVVFSLQQAARFQPAVFFPIRFGELVETTRVGSRYFVRFTLRGVVCLPEPGAEGAAHDWVERFTGELRRRVRETPYERSASVGSCIPGASEPTPPWDAASTPDNAFERSVEYLAKTETFAGTYFYRVRRVTEVGSDVDISLGDDGVLELRAGRTYELEVLHSQPKTPPTPQRFLIDVDGSTLQLIGHHSFDVASRYDKPVLRILATPAGGVETRETVIDIRPQLGVPGPTLNIPVRVLANKKRAATVATAQAVALISVALAGTLAFASHGVRIAVAVLGAVVAAGLQFFGWAPLRAPTMPAIGPTVPQVESSHTTPQTRQGR
jgi:hypothetical protein